MGQFELAFDLAQTVQKRMTGAGAPSEHLEQMRLRAEPPPSGPTSPHARPFRSDLPTPMLERMRKALHHQTYRGVQIVKSPFDMALYQQLIWNLRPRTIIEIGSKAGGSGIYFGDLLSNFDIDGHVFSYDIVPVRDVMHPFVSFAYGNGRQLDATLPPAKIQ